MVKLVGAPVEATPLSSDQQYKRLVPIYVFPEMKLRGLVPNSIHVSVSSLYIPRYMNVEIGRKNIIILFWK